MENGGAVSNYGSIDANVIQLIDVADKSKPSKVGDIVHISSLGEEVTVLEVDSSKGEIVIQAGIMKLKLKLTQPRIISLYI